MGNFRQDSGGFDRRSRPSNGRGGFGGGFGGRRSFGDRREDGGDRRDGGRRPRFEKHEVTCDKCGKLCDVPFKPTTGKPIFCRDCFGSGKSESGGMSQEQFKTLDDKLNKILKILESVEIEDIEDDGASEEESDEEDDSEESDDDSKEIGSRSR